jgi:uncharacterized protein with HEPN domain
MPSRFMNPRTLKRLEDAREAILRIQEFLKGVAFDTFLNSSLLQSAVERQLEIIGEALGTGAKEDDSLVTLIPELASSDCETG